MIEGRNTIRVLAGPRKEEVGTTRPQVGMRTNLGKIASISPSGVVTLEGGKRVINVQKFLTVALSEARRFGYRQTTTV